jgi:hypothetical protein
MSAISRSYIRLMTMLLACALLAASAPVASARPLTQEKIHARLVKQGMGNWVGVELANGTAFWGRIVSIDDQSFGLQLHNDPAITPVLYSDVVRLHTGVSRGALIACIAAGVGGVLVVALVAHHEMAKMPTLPTQPTEPLFP